MSSLLEPETMPLESHLAAIVILLSASALRGPSSVKAAALCAHLEVAVREERLDPHLRAAIEQVLTAWRSLHCQLQAASPSACSCVGSHARLH